ncbi:MAG: hypothetical protein H7315_15285 [Herminiimonas sp.]|nr:hypothetical protein [Herminiimonas sp.]
MIIAIGFALPVAASYAADTAYTQANQTQLGTRQTTAAGARPAQVDPLEQIQSEFWGLNIDEVRRAALLMKGPRGAFSAPNLTPIEVLGIHARSDAERQKYAELFSRILHADTERVLAWAVANAQANERLYPNEPVVDFSGSRRPVVEPSAAQAAMVPQWAITTPTRAVVRKKK